EYSKTAIANSDDHFAAPAIAEFHLENRLYPSAASLSAEELKEPPDQVEIPVLTWQSAVQTISTENNTAYATYFPHQNTRAAVIILPHWNAKDGTYFDLAKFI